ncbi:hypothetical protein [Dactylosporangium cerinum]
MCEIRRGAGQRPLLPGEQRVRGLRHVHDQEHPRRLRRLDPAAFDRLGAGTGKLLDDPSTTILVAADALPLLTQEAGLAPTPVPVPAATGSVAPVATGGSDFLRDRWVLLSVAGGLLLVAAVALLLGIRSSRRPAP